MLTLLKPWRDLRNDLKGPFQTWDNAFDEFISEAPKKIQDITSGIQHFHKCRLAAEDDRGCNEDVGRVEVVEGDNDLDDNLDEDAQGASNAMEFTEEKLAEIIASQGSYRENLHGQLAVEQAKKAKIFASDES